MIDFIIVRQRDTRDVRVTRAMRGVECWTDHRLVRSTMKLYTPPPYRNGPKTVRASYNTSKLKNPSHLEEYRGLLDEKLLMTPSLRKIALRNGPHSRTQLLRRYWDLKSEFTKTGLTKTVSQYKLI